MDYRHNVVEAAIAELRHQISEDSIWIEGTRVQVEGQFKMARVAEAIVSVAFADDDEALVNAVLKMFPAAKGEEHFHTVDANALLWDLREVMLRRLDPLP
jgi:hypothetical protein